MTLKPWNRTFVSRVGRNGFDAIALPLASTHLQVIGEGCILQ